MIILDICFPIQEHACGSRPEYSHLGVSIYTFPVMKPVQKFLQLPVTAVNMVKNHRKQEAKSPVLSPDAGVQTFYNALQADELRLLKSQVSEPSVQNNGSSSSNPSQPVRYGAPALPGCM